MENQSTAQQAVGLPRLQAAFDKQQGVLKEIDAQLASDPPDLPAFRQKAKQCWARFNEQDLRWQKQLRALSMSSINAKNDLISSAANDGPRLALEKKINDAKAQCQSADAW